MRFLVPQFIEVEPKIIGPITIRQFVICIVGGLFVFITYKTCDFSLFLFLGILQVVIFGVFAFFKVNGQPFHFFVLNVVQTFKKPTSRIWAKEEMKSKEKKGKETEKKKKEIPPRRPLPPSGISDLLLTVNTGGAYKEEE